MRKSRATREWCCGPCASTEPPSRLGRRSGTACGERLGMRAMLLIWGVVIVSGLAYFIAIGLAGR